MVRLRQYRTVEIMENSMRGNRIGEKTEEKRDGRWEMRMDRGKTMAREQYELKERRGKEGKY